MEWKPFKDVPRDGTWVIVKDAIGVTEVKYSPIKRCWVNEYGTEVRVKAEWFILSPEIPKKKHCCRDGVWDCVNNENKNGYPLVLKKDRSLTPYVIEFYCKYCPICGDKE